MKAAVASVLFIVIFSLSWAGSVQAQGGNFIFCTGGVEKLPQVDPNDIIEMWYFEAPVFETFFGDLGDFFNAFHTAFGFLDVTSGANYTVQYEAQHEILNATIPYVMEYDNGTKYLEWYNKGGVCVLDSLNWTYWEHNRTFVTMITGAQFNAFIDWTPSYNKSYPIYQLFDVYAGENGTIRWYEPSTCDSFNWHGFMFFHSIGVNYTFAPRMKHDDIVVFSSSPEVVDMDDPVQYDEVVSFYEYFRDVSTLKGFIDVMLTLMLDNKYIYLYGQYYMLHMNYPYFNLDYRTDPLPGQWGYHNYTEAMMEYPYLN